MKIIPNKISQIGTIIKYISTNHMYKIIGEDCGIFGEIWQYQDGYFDYKDTLLKSIQCGGVKIISKREYENTTK